MPAHQWHKSYSIHITKIWGRLACIVTSNNFWHWLKRIQNEKDQFGRKHSGDVDFVYFDSASNVKVTADIMEQTFPRVTAVHGTEYVALLIFQDVFNKLPEYMLRANMASRLCNVFGSTMHVPIAISNVQRIQYHHNHEIGLGFTKVSECR